MTEKRMVDARNMDFFPQRKDRTSKLKVSWMTAQGSQKKRGNPSVHYSADR
jgi:hypothetical protein